MSSNKTIGTIGTVVLGFVVLGCLAESDDFCIDWNGERTPPAAGSTAPSTRTCGSWPAEPVARRGRASVDDSTEGGQR